MRERLTETELRQYFHRLHRSANAIDTRWLAVLAAALAPVVSIVSLLVLGAPDDSFVADLLLWVPIVLGNVVLLGALATQGEATLLKAELDKIEELLLDQIEDLPAHRFQHF